MFSLFTFILITIAIAGYAAYRTKNINMQSQEGYFLGGRSLMALTIGSSTLLANLSTEQLVGLSGQTYTGSMASMAWEVTTPIALIFMAFMFLPKYLRVGVTTVTEFLEKRYDQRTRQIVSLLMLLGFASSFLPTVLYSGSLVLDQIFDISSVLGTSQFFTVLIVSAGIGLVGMLYIVFGGLKAIASADSLYGVGLIAGGLLILVLGLIALGNGNMFDGVGTLTSEHTDKLNAIDGSNDAQVPWPTIFMGLLFNNLFYFCINQAIVQRPLAARNLKEGQKGVMITALFKLFGAFYLVLPGVIAYHLYGNSLANGDAAYPTLVTDLLPPVLTGVFAAILFGAVLSSFNGGINSVITLFTLDLYKPLFHPDADETALVRAGRRFAMVVAIVSIFISPFILFAPSGLYNYLQEMFGFFNIPVLAIMVVGFYTKKVSPFAAKVAVPVHIILYGASKVFIGELNFLYVLSVLFPLSVIVMLVVGKFKPMEEPFEFKNEAPVDMVPWKYAKPAAAGLVIGIGILYVIFSPLGVAS
ncbi:solute:sodium symporter family transporter [Marinococcus halotolerans]|uniref:solute:sodium symporter family transporter n=1 Tax=Marinococcus halotolerans TaxID=301092 RepID=UPI0003B4E56D|nr:solute:sodium symporter family transporter [Marinococcus halotolerans]